MSYLRSFSSEDFTAIWKLYDLYGPTGTNDAVIVKQWRSREMEQFIYASFLSSKLYDAEKEKFQFFVGRIDPLNDRFWFQRPSYSIFCGLKVP